jgi:hypothetical protein
MKNLPTPAAGFITAAINSIGAAQATETTLSSHTLPKWTCRITPTGHCKGGHDRELG